MPRSLVIVLIVGAALIGPPAGANGVTRWLNANRVRIEETGRLYRERLHDFRDDRLPPSLPTIRAGSRREWAGRAPSNAHPLPVPGGSAGRAEPERVPVPESVYAAVAAATAASLWSVARQYQRSSR